MTTNTRQELAEAAKLSLSEAMNVAESAGHPLSGAGTISRLVEASAQTARAPTGESNGR